MPYTNLGLPFAAGSHTSYKAAQSVSYRRSEKMARLLAAYHEAGDHGLTDHEASHAANLPLQSICSLRNSAVDCGLIVQAGERMGPFGKANTIWKAR